ncbi:MAG TPA: restriction endonuclease subunit S [Thermoanaerobaculia bacterium]|nr:restriction endonuclease subunit S [Thermoanaerobaculia bacterium]
MEARLPLDWRILSLEACVEALIDYRGKSPIKSSHGVPLVTAKIVKSGRILPPEEFIPLADYDLWMRRGLPRAGDVVVTTEAPLGEVAQLGPEKVALAQRIILLRGRKNLLDQDYLLYAMQSSIVQRQLQARATGTTVHGIRQSELRKISLPVPPLVEQKAIAYILGALSQKVHLNEDTNRTLEAMARAIFKSWFSDGESGSQNIEEIYRVANVTYGAPFSSSLFNEKGEGEPLIRIRDLEAQSPSLFTTETPARARLAQPGDILVGMDGEFKAHIWCGPPAWVNQRVCLVEPKPHIPRAFLLYSLEEPLSYFERAKTGTNVIHLGKADIDTFRLRLPPQKILQTFGELTEPMLDKIILNRQESRTLAALRDTLLPKLLSGEIRIKQAEKMVGEAV